MRKRLTAVMALLFIAVLIVSIAGGCNSESSEPEETTVGGKSESPTPKKDSGGSESESSGSESENGQKMIEPTQLITRDEAKELLGEDVKEGEKNESQAVGLKTCYYNADKQDSKSFIIVSVIQQESISSDESLSPDAIFKALKQAIGDPKAANMGEIGDDVITGASSVHIMTDSYVISVAAGTADPAMVPEILKKAAELAVHNLKRVLGEP